MHMYGAHLITNLVTLAPREMEKNSARERGEERLSVIVYSSSVDVVLI